MQSWEYFLNTHYNKIINIFETACIAVSFFYGKNNIKTQVGKAQAADDRLWDR